MFVHDGQQITDYDLLEYKLVYSFTDVLYPARMLIQVSKGLMRYYIRYFYSKKDNDIQYAAPYHVCWQIGFDLGPRLAALPPT